MAKIEAVVFDLYGTLMYFSSKNTYQGLFLELGISAERMKAAKNTALTQSFKDLDELVRHLKAGATINIGPFEDDLSEELNSTALYPETLETLSELKDRGIRLGLISNLASPYKEPFFRLNLQEYFQSVLFSCDVKLRKPDQKIYSLMISNLGVSADKVLMVGNNLHCDVFGPTSIGMRAVLLDRNRSSLQSCITSLKGVFRIID